MPLLPGSPQVVLELYSGGANCCFIDQIFSYDPGTMAYVKTEHDFADAGATIKRLNGQYRFVSADGAFKYAFTDGADSGEPLQIWQFTAGGFVDVTRHYPGMIRKDAAFWIRIFGHTSTTASACSPRGPPTRNCSATTVRFRPRSGPSWPRAICARPPGRCYFAGGAKFIRSLNRTLVKLGYKR